MRPRRRRQRRGGDAAAIHRQGDTINLASRLNKVYGTTIPISQAVPDGCGPDFVTRVLDTVQVKGRAEAVTVYELVESRAKEISTVTSN